MTDVPRFERGMTVRIKDNDLRESEVSFGMNTEKRTFAGKLKVVKEVVHSGKAIKVFRNPEDAKHYRKGRDYWTFSIKDVEPGIDVEELEKEKNVEHLFDPTQLII
jgi:hypothetical protein